MVHFVLTSPQTQVYLSASATVTSVMTSWCEYWSTEKVILSSGTISCPFFSHLTGLFGLLSSHFKVNVSFSLTFWSLSGLVNSTGSSEKWK